MSRQMFIVIFAALLAVAPARAGQPDLVDLSWQMFWKQGDDKRKIAEQLAATGDKGLIPTFVLAMRWTRNNIHVAAGLSQLAGEEITDWHDAYVWQERNPQIVPHPSFRDIKLKFLEGTDQRFVNLFALPHGAPERMKIRLEEVSWGGAQFDSIPPLDQPVMIEAQQAGYLLDDDLVFGIEINGDVRAYPLRIMGWHEMMNDRIGDVPVALAYCTLCGSGILFETAQEGETVPHLFGSSGLLYRSNKLMFDRATNSLWNQFTGEPVVGPLVDSGIKLKMRPISITTWANWREQNPETTVLSLETGYIRNYDSGFVYNEYFASPELMFPAAVGDESLIRRKEYVFGLRDVGAARAWPVEAFRETRVINDKLGAREVVLIGDAETRTVRAYDRKDGETFRSQGKNRVASRDQDWNVTEEFLISQDGTEKRARIPGHVSYWFAWDNYLGVKSSLYDPQTGQ